MARIYKESRYVLQLLIGKSYVAQYKDVKISFYTKNPNNQVMVDNGITIKRNIVEVMVDSTLFDNLEEGLISYIVYGTKDGIPFIEERQSNYFLKAPLDFKPTTCILEDKSVTPSMGERNNDGYIVVEESEGYDGLSRVVIDPQTLYNEGINEQKTKLESISITENGIYSKEDGYNHIEVNVPPKINIQEAGINFAYSTFTEVPEWADFNGVTNITRMFYSCKNLQTIPLLNTSNATDMSYIFAGCTNLQTIPLFDTSNVTDMKFMLSDCNSLQTIPEIDTSNVTDMRYMFQGCSNLQTIPLLNTSNVTNMQDMFTNCENLQTIPSLDTSNVTNMFEMFNNCFNLQTIPLLNTSNVTNMGHMFDSCLNLQTIPQIDTSNVTDMSQMFSYCRNLQTIPKFNCQKVKYIGAYFLDFTDDMISLTDVGGWENLKIDWDDGEGLVKCPNLTYQSCINILNGLYDFVGNGSTETRTLKVHQNFLTTVGDEISIGTAKGWVISA